MELGSAAPPWLTLPIETLIKTCYGGPYSDAVEQSVANILQLKDYKFDLGEACIVDFFVTVIWWCKDQQLTPEQATAVIEISRGLLADIKQKSAAVPDTIRELKVTAANLVVKASNNEPTIPADKLGELVKFLSNMLIQHHKLWEFFFHRLHEETVICKDYSVETAPPAAIPWPPPLYEGCPESLYKAYLTPQSTAASTTTSQETKPPSGTQRETSTTTLATSATPAPPKTRESSGKSSGRAPKTSPSRKPASIEEDPHARVNAEKALAVLDKEAIKQIVEKTGKETATAVEQEILSKIRERENTLLSKINQIHKIATD